MASFDFSRLTKEAMREAKGEWVDSLLSHLAGNWEEVRRTFAGLVGAPAFGGHLYSFALKDYQEGGNIAHRFKYQGLGQPAGAMVVKLEDTTNRKVASHVLGTVALESDGGKTCTLNGIAGLPSGSWQITLLVFPR